MGKMRLEIKRKFTARTDRVKCVDIHPTEPWILSSLYNGSVWVWNYDTQATIKTFEVSELPVRAARFIPRKSWIVVGGDELMLKVYNYNTFERVSQFEAHNDYIRSIAVHPSMPCILSCADDLLIKLWDWDKGWKNIMTFEGHSHFVMQVAFNPKDSNTFASASLDTTVKVWSLSSPTPNFTLTGHEKGVNCVAYYHGNDKPYLISGADDKLAKIWDYQNKTCVASLEGHTSNVNIVAFHPELPIIITGGEDGFIKLWHSGTNKLEQSLHYSLDRVWSLAYQKGSNDLALGFDEGSMVIKLGREQPAVSLDPSGKLIWARHSLVLSTNLNSAADNSPDGESIPVTSKEMGTCEVFPQTLQHSPNGRFVVVTGDGEYIVYTALAWRNRSFGNALEFVWSPNNEYVVREGNSRLRFFDKQFKEKPTHVNLNYSVECIFSGSLLGVKSTLGFLTFYDWESSSIVRRIEVTAHAVFWNDIGDLVAIACKDSIFFLRYKNEEWQNRTSENTDEEEGVPESFDFLHEIAGHVNNGFWVSNCFIFTTSSNRLCYVIGSQIFTLVQSENNLPIYLLGYLHTEQRVFYCDKEVNLYSWKLPVAIINYQTAIIQGDMLVAATLLPEIKPNESNKVAQFLDKQGHLEIALEVTADEEHRFDLALRIPNLEVAQSIASSLDLPQKWKEVADCALKEWEFVLAAECLERANDLEGLFLIYMASGNLTKLKSVSERAVAEGKNNLAFSAYLSMGEIKKCIDLLISTGKMAEAALMARTHAPSLLPNAFEKWKKSLPDKMAEALEDVEVSLLEKEAEEAQIRTLSKAMEYVQL